MYGKNRAGIWRYRLCRRFLPEKRGCVDIVEYLRSRIRLYCNAAIVLAQIKKIDSVIYNNLSKSRKRNELKIFLLEYDIELGINYISCHHFSLYKGCYTKFSVTDAIHEEIL